MKLTPEAKELLTRCYHNTTVAELARRLRVDIDTVRRWAGWLGLENGRREWCEKRISEVYPDSDRETLEALCKELGMTRDAVRKKANRLGLKRTDIATSRALSASFSRPKKRLSTKFAALAQAYEARKKTLSPQQEAALRAPDIQPQPRYISFSERNRLINEKIKAEYAERRAADIAIETQTDYYSVVRRAKRLGVEKSAEFMHTSCTRGACHGWKIKGEERKAYITQADEYMRRHFATTKNAEIARLFGVDEKTVRRWARRLGLQKSEAFMQAARGRCHAKIRQGYYTPEHEAWREQRIREVYPDGDEQSMQQLAQELGIKRQSIQILASRYGLRRSKERVSEAMIEANRRNGRTKYDAAFIAALREYYPDHTNRECADHFGISAPILAAVAHHNGIRKSKEHLQQFKTWATRECASLNEK